MNQMDLSQYYRKLNKQKTILGTVRRSLNEILPLLSKTRLSEIASLLNVPGRSKLNKQELADALPQYIVDPYKLERTLLLCHDEEMQLLQKLLNESAVQDNEITPLKYSYLMGNGLLFTFFDNDKFYIVMPEEVQKALELLDWNKLTSTWSAHLLVMQYINASVNLYGVCRLERILDMYNSQNEPPLTQDELEKIMWFHLINRTQQFGLHDGYIVSNYFDDENQDEFNILLSQIKHKPHYVPDKELFLKYSDSNYFEMTPQLLKLRLFILNQLCDDVELVDYAIEDIQLACSMEEPLQEIIYELERRDIIFNDMEQVKWFTALITDVYNNTRIWSNCGHTPLEMRALSEGSPIRTITGQRVIPLKIGRNDPCYCGSGKKHKKCCGK